MKRALGSALVACALGGLTACGGGDTHEAPDYGAPCGATVACPSGLACLPTADATGYCTVTCDATSCPDGTTCNHAFGAAVCLAPCMADTDCHATQQCWAGSCQPACGDDAACGGGGAHCAAGRCSGPECTNDGDCGMGRACSGGRCVLASDGGVPTMGDGSPCTRSAECTSGICLPPERGGVCSVACTNTNPCFFEPFPADCGTATVDGTFGTFCVPFTDGLGGNGSACASDADCGNQTCVQAQCRGVCEADGQCLRGQHCQPVTAPGGTFMGCGYDPGPASGTVVRIVDLGDYDVAANSGTPNISFATPPETISVTLRARATSGDPLDMFFYEVFDAAGQVFSLPQMSMYVDQPVRWYPFDATSAVAMLIPNATTDHYTYHPGLMRFTMAAYGASSTSTGTVHMHVDAVEVLAASEPTTGSLHLRVHLVGVSGVTAATAPSSARMTAFLNRFTAILAMVGISVAEVTFVDVNAPALANIDSADGESSELSQLFRMSAPAAENVLNLFLVQSISAGDSGEFNTLGIAGGIPGPPGIHGSSHSGVVIAYDPGAVGTGTAGGDLAGHVAAHEVGHFLGLFHTTEQARRCTAGETPTAANPCAPFGGTDTIGDTTYGSTGNLMHYVVMGSNWNLTAGQGFVERRNPLTQQ